MPVPNYQQYCEMLKNAKSHAYAYPAVNVSSITTANAAMKAFAEQKSDGIIQISIGGAEFSSGMKGKNGYLGAISIAEHIHRMAAYYDVFIAVHSDHCVHDKVDSFLIPLIKETEKRRKAGLSNLFNSHMFDGSDIPLKENMAISEKLLKLCADNDIVLEVEVGVVGGEEDGKDNSGVLKEKLYTTPEDMLYVFQTLDGKGKYIVAATFGNVHGVYKPGNVKLKPAILKAGQEALMEKYGKNVSFELVFHGGSGSLLSEIHEALQYGVVKMNVDTDTQYAFTRQIADHFFKNYDTILKVDGEVGNKKMYDPRAYLKLAEAGMKARIMQICDDLKSTGKTLFT